LKKSGSLPKSISMNCWADNGGAVRMPEARHGHVLDGPLFAVGEFYLCGNLLPFAYRGQGEFE
jgi:hypothetical protein